MIYYWWLFGVGLGIVIFAWAVTIKKSAGTKLNKAFISLGDLTGKSYEEIERVAGPATSIDRKIATNTKRWVSVATWSKGDYYIIIMFNDKGIFDHICSQGKS